ncbi:Vitamin B12 dependent methionine synthase activation subunit [Desulforamulus putei]|uniref:Vitamin B12 dependent methionine synthase activation subunit n=1 Tax=Desulforamulus putei TaxID=74701 RepID=UPI002FDD4172
MLLPQIPVEIQHQQVLGCLGATGKQRIDRDLLDQVNEMILLGKSLLQPAAAVAQVRVSPAGDTVYLSGAAFHLPDLSQWLKGCSVASVAAVTVGETIEKEVERLFHRGLATRAVILDAVGTEAAEGAANQVVKLLARQMRIRGLFPTPRLGPGYRGLKMDYLPLFLEMAGGEQIAVTCNNFFQMNPVKSLCFMVGWSSEQQKEQVKCDFCHQANCQFRAVRTEGESGVVF